MSTFVISVLVIGGAIAVIIGLTVGEVPKPATAEPPDERARVPRHRAAPAAPPIEAAPQEAPRPRPAEAGEPFTAPTTTERTVSGVLLGVLLVGVGTGAALVIGVVALVTVELLRHMGT